MRLKIIIPLLLILIIAAFFRFFLITEIPPGLYPDEAMNGNNALEAIKTGEYKIFYPENNGREGMFINIQAFFLTLIQKNEPWVLRLPSAIFGILTVLGIFFLAKELFRNSKVALLSSFLLATSFWHINFSRIGFRAIMAPLLLTWGIYLLLISFHKGKLLIPILAGFIYGLGFHTYIAYRITPLIFIPILWHYRHHENFKKITALFLLATFLAFLPLGLYFFENPKDFFGRTTQVSIFAGESPLKDLALNSLKTLGAFNFVGDWNWRHNYAGNSLLFWPAGIIFLIGLGIAIISIIKNYNSKSKNNYDSTEVEYAKILRFAFCILILWLIITSLPVVVSNEGIPHSLRMILMIPPVFILAGYGGIKLFEFLVAKSYEAQLRKIWAYALVLLFLGIILYKPYQTYFIKWGKNKEVENAFAKNYVEIGKEINKLPLEIPKYIIVEAKGTDVRGFPMPTQTVMFLTDSFRKEGQIKKNIHYILPNSENLIPKEAKIFYIK